METILILIAGFAILLAVFSAFGGFSLLNRKENPEKVIGKDIILHDFDGLGGTPPDKIDGKIINYENERYKTELKTPLIYENKDMHIIYMTARHVGYPISKISKHGIIAANCSFKAKLDFIANVNLK